MDKYKTYDRVVSYAIERLYEIALKNDSMSIAPFNPRKKSHCFVLKIAVMIRNVWRPALIIKINKGWLTRHKWNKGQDLKIATMTGTDWEEGVVDPDELVKDVVKFGKSLDESFDLDELYKTYYV